MVYLRLIVLEHNGDNVEACVAIKFMLEDVGIGGCDKPQLLLARNRNKRLTVIVIVSCLDLHDDQILSVLGHDINFLVLVTPIPLQNLIALPYQILYSQFFII